MNAFLLAAGNGTRLRPITDDFQKCMLPIKGKPMLEWWLDAVFSSDCFETVYVNIHHCADQVENWLLGDYLTRRGNYVRIIDERSGLLGTAKTLYWHADPVEDFMVVYTDTFMPKLYKSIPNLVAIFKDYPKEILAGLVSMESPKDGSAASIRTDAIGNVSGFVEKNDYGFVSWAGVMFGRAKALEYIRSTDKDLATDVLPRLTGRMRIISHTEAYDIGKGVEHYEELSRRL